MNEKQEKLTMLRQMRDRARAEHRPAQALLLDNVIFEIEQGCTWLDYIKLEDSNAKPS